MILPIDAKYRITSDRYQWTIQEARKRKGKISWEGIQFYSSLEGAVNGLAGLKLRLSDARCLADALSEAQRIATSLTHALSPEYEVRTKRVGAPVSARARKVV